MCQEMKAPSGWNREPTEEVQAINTHTTLEERTLDFILKEVLEGFEQKSDRV